MAFPVPLRLRNSLLRAEFYNRFKIAS